MYYFLFGLDRRFRYISNDEETFHSQHVNVHAHENIILKPFLTDTLCSRVLDVGRLLPKLIPEEIVLLVFSHNVHPIAAEG